jgi:hypothetical protein
MAGAIMDQTKIVEDWLWTQVILWKRWKQGVSLLVQEKDEVTK